MFDLISTQNLFLVGLKEAVKVTYNRGTKYTYPGNQIRYTLVRKTGCTYMDIFTGITYPKANDVSKGEEFCAEIRGFITTKKYITKREATFILQELNPTYLPFMSEQERNSSKLNLKR